MTGAVAPFSAYVVADDLAELLARGKQVMPQFGPLAASCAFFFEAGAADGTAVFVAPVQAEHMDQAALLVERAPELEPATLPVQTDASALAYAGALKVGGFWARSPGLEQMSLIRM